METKEKLLVEKIKFHTEIEFNGSVADFVDFTKQLVNLDNTKIRVEWDDVHPTGCSKLASYKFFDKEFTDRHLKDIRPIQLQDIYGGIRTPHIHLDDFNVIFLNRDVFKQVVDYSASRISSEISKDINFDHVEFMDKMRKL